MMRCFWAAEPPGVHHGLGHQAHGRAVGRIGSSSLHRQVRGCFPKLPDYSHVGLQRHHRRYCRASGLLHRHGYPSSPLVSQGRHRGPQADQAAGSAGKGHARIRRADAPGRDDQSAYSWVRVFHLVVGSAGGAPGQDHRHSCPHGPTRPPVASPRVLVPAAQAHDERQAGRGGIRKIQGPTAGLKKKPSERTPPKPWFSRTRSRYIATRR
jgi:hypothetical protein